MIGLFVILLVLALTAFLLATFNVAASVNWTGLGLALATIAFLVQAL